MKKLLYLILLMPLALIGQDEDPCYSINDYNILTENNNPQIEINLVIGWNMIGYPCTQEILVQEAFNSIADDIILLKNNNGNVYMPEFNFNGIGFLEGGYGYQIKVSSFVLGFTFCESIQFPVIEGCTDCDAVNFNKLATTDDESCILDTDGDGVLDINEVVGCQDPNGCNYDSLSTDEGLCEYAEIGYDCEGNIIEYIIGMDLEGGTLVYYDSILGNGIVASLDNFSYSYWGCYEQEILGANSFSLELGFENTLSIDNQCSDENSAASISLDYSYQNFSDWFLPTISLLEIIHQEIGLPNDIYWSSTQFDNNSSYVFDSSTSTYLLNEKWSSNRLLFVRPFGNWVIGCNDEAAFNYDNDVTLPNSFTCIPVILGCIDSLAFNYDSESNTDDGSCCYVSGCTDESSTNYDINACFDDGTCGLDFLSTSQNFISSGSFRNLKVFENDIVSISPGETTILFVEDTCIISGIINGDGSALNEQCNQSWNSNPCPIQGSNALSSGGGSGGGYAGGDWGSSCNTSSESGHGNIYSTSINGGKGGTSFYWSGGNVYCGLGGGEGGAGLIINTNVLIFDGEISVVGGNGRNCAQSRYGHWATGGGGGGSVYINANEILNQSGSVINDGGNGGNCSNTAPYQMTPASNGSNGQFLIEN